MSEAFIDEFMALPNSFYAPRAPEKFQQFIDRFGKHYTQAAKFGGKLKIVKTKVMMTEMSITDAKDEAQKEMDEIVGNSFNKNKVDKKTTGDGVAFAAQGEGEEEFEYF